MKHSGWFVILLLNAPELRALAGYQLTLNVVKMAVFNFMLQLTYHVSSNYKC